MRLEAGTLSLAPSDLSRHLGCSHASALAIQVARGERSPSHAGGEYQRLIQEKGEAHEQEFLARTEALGLAVTKIERVGSFADMAERTREAMVAGAPVIYQATFVRGRWRGQADFLERVERESGLGGFGYEAIDTKLARNEARPSHVLQLCFYSAGIAAVQGLAPVLMHLELGSGRRESLRPRDFDAYFARAQASLERFVDARPATVAYPCASCTQCGFAEACNAEWRATDHLSFIAGIRRDQAVALEAAGVGTLARLAEDAVVTESVGIPQASLTGLHAQASLQARTRASGTIATELLPAEPGRGFELLPEPSRLDLAIDLEGDPFWRADRELTFMFGLLSRSGEEWAYRSEWAHDELGERALAGAVIDAIHERLREDPAMHVYHYGHVEVSVLKRLCMLYATHEEELDQLLRREVFVDLLQAVRQSMRLGLESYSLKAVEDLPGFVRHADVGRGADAVLEYERYLVSGETRHLRAIEQYNDEDCRATVAVLNWLRSRAPGGVTWRVPKDGSSSDEGAADPTARDRLREQLVAGEGEGSERWLAGELLAYHRRAAKPQWWAYYARREMTSGDLIADGEALGGLEVHDSLSPEEVARSLAHPMTFPPQEHKVAPSSSYEDAETGKSVAVHDVDADRGVVWVKRGRDSAEPLPRALIPSGPPRTTGHADALERLALSVRDRASVYPVLERLLRNDPPVIVGRSPGDRIQTNHLQELRELARGLDQSTLVIQGPPGTGKTYTGARLITDLVRAGKRVGLTALSHKAIDNLCREIETAAADEGLELIGTRHGKGHHDGALITARDGGSYADSAVIAGTSWLFAKEDWDHQLDYLVVDEAGQFALADALACGTSARNLILLGDPSQLSQVVQGTHPPGSDVSALAHVLGDEQTIPEDRGIFLDVSWRMRPEICSFISSEFYDGRLRSHDSCSTRSTTAGVGLRLLAVEHVGNGARSPQEAAAIRSEIDALLRERLTEQSGRERPIVPGDIMVVTPYNAQAHTLLAALPAGVRVGTVDRFQGQEAPIVFFSMATSSGEDAPRDAGFLFSRNRLNVAISRAQSLAILVCSPTLLDTRASTVENMRLVNTLCRLADAAGGSLG